MCQSSFIFLASIRVIQCAGKRERFLKMDHGHGTLCKEPLVKMRVNLKPKYLLVIGN